MDRLHIHLGVQVDFLKLVNSVCTIAVVVLVYARYWLMVLLKRISVFFPPRYYSEPRAE
jgi:hypothetical protein